MGNLTEVGDYQSSVNGTKLSKQTINALQKIKERIPPDELIRRFRRFFDGFVYNAQGNIDIKDQEVYREIENLLESLYQPPE